MGKTKEVFTKRTRGTTTRVPRTTETNVKRNL